MATPVSATPSRRVEPATRLRGRIRIAPVKALTLLAGVASGTSIIRDASDAEDPRSTAACLRALGVEIERVTTDSESSGVEWRVTSPGWEGWRRPGDSLPCGNSGTTLRLLAGLLAATPFTSTLDGDASLRRRPMARVVEPLRRMGADVRGGAGDTLPPLTVTGRRPLAAIDHAPTVPSAQVKSAVLLAALAATGTTTVDEPLATRDHTERMLRARGVAVRTDAGSVTGSSRVSVTGPVSVAPRSESVPGDVSAATFWLVAAAVHPDAELTLERVGVNPTRRAAIDLLRRMGAEIDESVRPDLGGGEAGGSDAGWDETVGEPVADLSVRSSRLEGIRVDRAEVALAIDEVPALAVAAAFATGTTRFEGVDELRRKESDRVAGIEAGLRALGVRVEVDGDSLIVHGQGGPIRGATNGDDIDTLDDHRLVMAFAVAALAARSGVSLSAFEAASVSYPGFFDHLERVRT